MISYIQLIEKIKEFYRQHKQVIRFEADFIDQMGSYSQVDDKFPFVYMSYDNKTMTPNTSIYNFVIHVWDLTQADRSNINTILSDCDLIATDLWNFLWQNEEWEYNILGTPTITPMNNGLLDSAAGVRMLIRIEMNNYCIKDIPLQPETFYIIDEEGDIIITNEGDNLIWFP
jgi:hypothetical protein